MTPFKRLAIGAMLFAGLSGPAAAGVMWCSLTIQRVGHNASGLVMIDTEIGTFYMCLTSQPYLGINPETCKGMLSIFLTAKSTGAPMDFAFDFGAAPAPNCVYGVAATWAAPNPYPYYFGMR
jgi:hypothetical protein